MNGNSDQSCNQVTGATKIGTCGFGMAQAEYARTFSCVEVQHTFYEPPRLTTLNRWRTQMPADFEFTLKAWQLITHEAKSPTYRGLKRQLSETEKAEAGGFRETAIVNDAWRATLASAHVLKAKTILFQCPSSFKQTAANIARSGWRYQYELGELKELATLVKSRRGYVFFNNSKMTEDALNFCKLLGDREHQSIFSEPGH